VGVGSQYLPFSQWLQIALGILSCVYLIIRIFKALRDWNSKDHE
jgi:hypothetical protein